ncbi:hypothetical protein ACWEO1_06350 [Kitasatospora cineracea]
MTDALVADFQHRYWVSPATARTYLEIHAACTESTPSAKAADAKAQEMLAAAAGRREAWAVDLIESWLRLEYPRARAACAAALSAGTDPAAALRSIGMAPGMADQAVRMFTTA